MIAEQNSRVQLIQGLVYGLIVSCSLWAITIACGEVFFDAYQVLTLLSGLLSFFMFRRFSLTASWRLGHHNSIAKDIIVNWAWVIAALLLLALLTRYGEYFARRVLLIWFFSVPILFFLVHLTVRRGLSKLIPQLLRKRSTVIVFANDSARLLGKKLLQSESYNLLGYFDDRDVDRTGGGIPSLSLLGSARSAAQYVRDHQVEVVFVVLPDSAARRAMSVIDELGNTTASLYYVPDFLAFSFLKAQLSAIETVPVLQIAESPFYGVDGLLKQIFDFCFALIASIVIAPVLLVAAIAVKLSSPGPVLFRQKRYGLNGNHFWVYKFRSMKVDAEHADQRQASQDDERITRVGRFIRKTSIDELPQFLNVLKGEMSVVGPRPHTVSHNEFYRSEIRRYMLRHKVKPGITGWAQVNGLRGETKNIERMEERIRYDLEYIRDWSPGLDLKIILLTVWAIIRGDENAY